MTKSQPLVSLISCVAGTRACGPVFWLHGAGDYPVSGVNRHLSEGVGSMKMQELSQLLACTERGFPSVVRAGAKVP